MNRWSRLLTGFAAVLIVFVVIASIIGSPPGPKPVANTEAPTPANTVVGGGLLCSTEAAIVPSDRGTPLICALAKDGKLRWRRV